MSQCSREISYYERKLQDSKSKPCILNKKGIPATVKSYRTLEILKDSGLEYISSNPVFNIVETSLYPERHITQKTADATYSFLYIISKNIGDQLYFKFGSGGNIKQSTHSTGLNRIASAQTFLIPGIGDNVGFKVHFLFFFKKTTYLDKSSMHEFIEKSIHKILQLQFKAANIKFGTEKSSEWYLLRKPHGQSDDPKFFCGFIIDVLKTYANYEDILAPNTIWKLSENNKYTKQLLLPSIVDSMKRLVINNGIYFTILKLLESKGIRKQRPYIVEIEEGDESTIRNRKGTIAMYKNELMEKTDSIIEPDGTSGSLFHFSGGAYIIVDIILNNIKYSFGQPLESNEIYVKFRPYNKNDVSIMNFHKQNIKIIPKYLKQEESEIMFSDYYMKIEDYLRIIKPPENRFKDWILRENYIYYESRRKGKTYETFEIQNNIQLPDWYFASKIQEFWSKVFVGSFTNPKYKKYQKTHIDSKFHSETDKIQYEWKVVARTIYKNEYGSNRANILLKRSTIIEPIIDEEIPVTRLMMIFNIVENVEEKIIAKPEIRHGDAKQLHYMIKKDFTCRLPIGYFNEDFENNRNVTREIATYRVHKVYEKHIFQEGEHVETDYFMEIGQIFPHENYKTYHVSISSLPLPKQLIVIPKQSLLKGDLLQFNSSSLKNVKPSKKRPESNNAIGSFEYIKDKQYFYSMRDVKYIGIDSKRNTIDVQYVKIEDVLVEDEFIYKLQYLPPYDKVKLWKFPYIGERVEKTFDDNINYTGVVTNIEPLETEKGNPDIYSVVYNDYEKEDLYLSQLQKIMLNTKKQHQNKNLSIYHYVYANDLDKYLQKKIFVIKDRELKETIFNFKKKTEKKKKNNERKTRKLKK